MGFKLKKAIFKVDCKHPNCPFNSEFTITQNIMGVTEDDVENEAKKLCLGMAKIKHDAVYGTKHQLDPTIKKLSVLYEAIGAKTSTLVNQVEAVKYKDYKKGEVILKKGDIATTICEVVKGHAYVEKNPTHKYKTGDSFGAAALLVNQTRTTDIIAGEDNTTIAFYNLQELNKKDPRKAKELYTEAMEDIFNIIREMEVLIDKLESDLEKEKMISENRRARVEDLEKELIACQKEIAEFKGKDSFK